MEKIFLNFIESRFSNHQKYSIGSSATVIGNENNKIIPKQIYYDMKIHLFTSKANEKNPLKDIFPFAYSSKITLVLIVYQKVIQVLNI